MEMHTLREFFPVERVAAASGSEVTPQLLTKAHATAAPKTAATFPQKRVLASVHLAHGDKSAIAAYQSAGHVELPPAQKGVDEDGAMLYDDPTGVVRSVKDGTIEYRNANRELIATVRMFAFPQFLLTLLTLEQSHRLRHKTMTGERLSIMWIRNYLARRAKTRFFTI